MIGDRFRRALAGQDTSGSVIPGVDKLRLKLAGNSQAVDKVRKVRAAAGYSESELPFYQQQYGQNVQEWHGYRRSYSYTPPSCRSGYSAPLGPISTAPGTPHATMLTEDQMARKPRPDMPYIPPSLRS